MNKKALFAGAIFLVAAMTFIVVHDRMDIRISPGSRQVAPANTDVAAAPKQEAPPVQVRLVGITTILEQKRALLRVEPPAGTSNWGESYILSEGQSKDGLAVETIDTTNATVTLRVAQVRRTLRLGTGSQG